MRIPACALILALAAGCGGSEEPKPKPAANKPAAKPAAAPAAAVKSDPDGKHLCITCKIRTNDAKCPGCGAVLKADTTAHAPKASGAVGKSAVAALYACPKEGCTYTEAKKNTCLKHGDTQLVEQWFVCQACSKKEPAAGKCAGCGNELKRTLQ